MEGLRKATCPIWLKLALLLLASFQSWCWEILVCFHLVICIAIGCMTFPLHFHCVSVADHIFSCVRSEYSLQIRFDGLMFWIPVLTGTYEWANSDTTIGTIVLLGAWLKMSPNKALLCSGFDSHLSLCVFWCCSLEKNLNFHSHSVLYCRLKFNSAAEF